MPTPTLVDMLLFAIFLAVLILPFKVGIVEHNLEVFLFVMGALAVTVTGKWEMGLVREAAGEPLTKGIVPAVLVAGLVFYYGKSGFDRTMKAILRTVPLGAVIFTIVVVLGLISSVITAIIAALLLVEIVDLLPLPRRDEVNLVIIACFSIGLGAVLTPLGEPLSTIAVVKLAGPPFHATFWYLFDQLGILICLGVLACGVFGVLLVGEKPVPVTEGTGAALLPDGGDAAVLADGDATLGEQESVVAGGVREVLVRAVKVYAFVAALFLLGAGMQVIIDKYFTQVPATILYWLNMVSAILDNATLTAAEIAPSLSQAQVNAALMGLLISGGMLIPGNIPNIISAGKLGIKSSEWARLGVPLGLAIMAVYFVGIFFLGFSPRIGLL